MMRIKQIRGMTAGFGTALAMVAAAGCYREGGAGASLDRYTYVSTAWQPKTVTLVDYRTGQEVWSVDIPVGKQLVLDFDKGAGTRDAETPDLMQWELMEAGKKYGRLDNAMPVPPSSARLIKMELRAAPEWPEGTRAPVPVVDPAPVEEPEPIAYPAPEPPEEGE